MSWDIVIFNFNRQINSIDEVDETVLVDIGTPAEFKKIIEDNYPDVRWDDGWGIIDRDDYSIEFGLRDTDEPFSNTMFHLYCEKSIYSVVRLCKKMKWQVYDTGLDAMLDLENPQNNGYENHQEYVRQILGDEPE